MSNKCGFADANDCSHHPFCGCVKTAPSKTPLTDADRLDWLEQLSDAEIVLELVINWTFAGKRHETGIRNAIDAAIKGGK